MSFRLTVRQGPNVTREKFGDLDAALATLEARAREIRSQGPLEARSSLRSFEPADQVAGRLEISTGTLFRRGREAGIDVMGDGTFIAFQGGFRRTELDPGDRGPFEALRHAMSNDEGPG